MAQFTITLDDPNLLAGLEWARSQYNASLPKDGVPFADDQSYVQWVATQAATSYATQMHQTQIAAKVQAASSNLTDLVALSTAVQNAALPS